MNVDQIKAHPFFYGVDWAAIRQIDAPFVPHLRSIVDTSYFPTEEYENVPDQPVGADTSDAKDLAFLGCANIYRLVSRKDVPFIIPFYQVHVQTLQCQRKRNVESFRDLQFSLVSFL